MSAGALIGNLSWLAASLPEYRRFGRDAGRLEDTQRKLLASHLRRNANSQFGLEHGFADIKSWEEYSQRVPCRDYDEHLGWINRIAAGEDRVLTNERVLLFEPSSGSSGAAKWIPYTAQLTREIRRAVAVWISGLFLSQPQLLAGRAYWSLTPQVTVPQNANSAVPVGFDEDSAYLGNLTRSLINRTLATQPALRNVQDMEVFWRLTLLMLMRCADLALISVWHPSFLTLLIDRLRADWTSLLHDLGAGMTLVDPPVRVPPSPRRSRELAAEGCDDLHRIWPKLRLISCWSDRHAATYAAELQALFPHATLQPKGLVATEAFVTIPLAEQKPLAIRSHVYEFLDGDDEAHPPWELERGQIYTVVVTMGGGFYRYRLGDQVSVEDFFQDVPCLRFLGKDDQVSDYFGEKLSENFVASAVSNVLDEFGLRPSFTLLAMEDTLAQPTYVLYLEMRDAVPEQLDRQLDRELRANPHYDLCIRLGQLGAVRIARIPDRAFDRYAQRMAEMGMRVGDVKPTPLSRFSRWQRAFGVSLDL